MAKKSEKTDYSDLLKTNLPLSQQTHEELDDALKNDKINWEDLSKDLKQAYNRFGLEYKDCVWHEMLMDGNCMVDDYFGIENTLNFFQLMHFNFFNSKQEMYNLKRPLIYGEWALYKKGLNEGYLKVENCPKEVKKAYREFLQKEKESAKKDYSLLQNIKFPLSWEDFVQLMDALNRGHIKRKDFSYELKDACHNFNKEVINEEFWEK
jgi:hypothetical protein